MFNNYHTGLRMRYQAIREIGAATLTEVLVGMVLIVTVFASIFELNAVCLRYIDATKESVAALQRVQDRAELLRNLAFKDLVDAAAVRNLMINPPNEASFGQMATETV